MRHGHGCGGATRDGNSQRLPSDCKTLTVYWQGDLYYRTWRHLEGECRHGHHSRVQGINQPGARLVSKVLFALAGWHRSIAKAQSARKSQISSRWHCHVFSRVYIVSFDTSKAVKEARGLESLDSRQRSTGLHHHWEVYCQGGSDSKQHISPGWILRVRNWSIRSPECRSCPRRSRPHPHPRRPPLASQLTTNTPRRSTRGHPQRPASERPAGVHSSSR